MADEGMPSPAQMVELLRAKAAELAAVTRQLQWENTRRKKLLERTTDDGQPGRNA